MLSAKCNYSHFELKGTCFLVEALWLFSLMMQWLSPALLWMNVVIKSRVSYVMLKVAQSGFQDLEYDGPL